MTSRPRTKPLSQRAYARHRGCAVNAVQEAIRVGRLKKCLTADGKIADADAADAEWSATTHADRRPLTGPAGQMPEVGGDRLPRRAKAPDLGASMARKAAADAGLAELKLAKERGELVCVAVAERKMVEAFGACRMKLLGVHARARQRDPGLTDGQVVLFEELIREALTDLSGVEEIEP